ncbi:ATP-dependent nuclease subunit A [Granulibacter bethesdensis]|uniref:DNA 3'-5' helicase n=1 Tax=Granulibacter bethesdensis TaxID=364410 RepID=A0AAC9P985_9PROT|nr:double-strand break repair helicase AddA [Granulibacter bethesdensis]APH55326.1 ATP-dependent nuclease subunit A [Granulibacter bethesdensis]APH62913.1 ATP-dependent nuclease subunit A [Granulibacter bethesdensis]
MSATLSPRDEAERNQRDASDPVVSAFVSASAGSGKTKLLTDRLLRLMLSGAHPGRIQCLTFTKAGAAEMAIRLRSRLGAWVTMSDAALDQALTALAVKPDDDARLRARALFAQVLDLPGGMRIETIHAFCQSLLRRFPLEAALSPHFKMIEPAEQEVTRQEAQETMLAATGDHASLSLLSGQISLQTFGMLSAGLHIEPDRLHRLTPSLAGLEAAQRRALGVPGSQGEEALLAAATEWPAIGKVREAARDAFENGSNTVRERAGQMLAWLSLSHTERQARWEEWASLFLTAKGEPSSPKTLFNENKANRGTSADTSRESLVDESHRIVSIRQTLHAIRLASLSAALTRLAIPVADAYAKDKARRGLVDFTDLIGRTRALLREPGAAWVLYKLDGGIDHLLLDEVQDTAPEQWEIAGTLTAEFFAGLDDRAEQGKPRTVFAVGDPKQSIYSFQGADPHAFRHWRSIMAQRVQQIGYEWRDRPLTVSFRSTAPVLALTDAVFADPLARQGVIEPAETLRHLPDRAEDAGTVEVWEPVQTPEIPPRPAWQPAEEYGTHTTAASLLAGRLADWIASQIGQTLPSENRPIHAGDYLILLRRRKPFAPLLERALKLRGVPVAGLDRLPLTSQPAVADLLALCDTLLLPDDDMALACLLTSPLGGLSDDSLMALALGRRETLWDTLRKRRTERTEWDQAASFLEDMLGQVDYTTPHALLSAALVRHRGRARLFKRLGAEAAEPIDELLNAAMRYAQLHPPSLQGFVHWLRRSAPEVKREMSSGGQAVRIMTVHGSKGLEAPIVILPDTVSTPRMENSILWTEDPETGLSVPLWKPNQDFQCDSFAVLEAKEQAARQEEYNRLLYVALTRARDRLLVCGWLGKENRPPPEESWYAAIRRGMERLPDAETIETDHGEVIRLISPQQRAAQQARADITAPIQAPPSWMGQAPDWQPAPRPAEPVRPEPLAPSRPDNADLGPVPAADSPLIADRRARFRRGQVIHQLLQHLPLLPAKERDAAMKRFLMQTLPSEADHVAKQIGALLDHPRLAALFGSDGRGEVPLTGVIGPDDKPQVIGGIVDRLAVLPERILIADYKTNRHPPASIADTPVLYLRQMAAYRAVLSSIYPDRDVLCALIWTETGRIDTLPSELLDHHAPGVSMPAFDQKA